MFDRPYFFVDCLIQLYCGFTKGLVLSGNTQINKGRVADRKRLFRVTAGNVRQSHIYVNGHFDFFPADCVGSPKGGNSDLGKFKIILEGLNKIISTDIGSDARTGKPRTFFRGRSWVKEFFKHHHIQTGTVLAMERLAKRRYRLYPFDSKSDRELDWHWMLEEWESGDKPTVLELFAGCGGMTLGFQRAGFQTVMANEWDAAACDTIRKNLTDRVAQCAVEEIDQFPKADVVAGGPPCQGFSNLGEHNLFPPTQTIS